MCFRNGTAQRTATRAVPADSFQPLRQIEIYRCDEENRCLGNQGSDLDIHLGLEEQRFSGDGVGKTEAFGTQKLAVQPFGQGVRLGSFAAVLGINQNREAHVAAMEPQLVGPAGDGAKLKFT